MNETWKDVKGFEKLYQVSNLGDVRSITRYKKVLKPYIDKDGYRTVILKHNGGEKHCRVARLVATAFIQRPNGKNIVNHLDMNRKNDRADNLEWCTQKENVTHSLRNGRYKGANLKKVKQIRDKECIKIWDSLSAASKSLGIPVSNISKCLSGERSKAGGFSWELATEVEITGSNEITGFERG